MKNTMFYAYAAAIGLLGGMTSGLFGVGGGVVMVPAMMLLLGVDIKTAIGTSLAVIVPTAITGTAKHHFLGNLNWKVALALAPGAMLGGYYGAKLTRLIPAEDLKRYFGAFLVLVGLRLIFGR
ncbi:MAG: sulfite exporter TauE/SafE family protein [Verrucomicrobia bacterium]|nr:sulfite exporter TauE/SafE family protein [Verrucomicrobiota bacterium]